MVNIIIPIYKEIPNEDERISLDQVFKILKNHKITFVHPQNLKLTEYRKYSELFVAFGNEFFEDIHGYNKLLLSVAFYKSFYEKYLLIYQTDCFVFSDELNDWCNKDFDYIGAPWIRSFEKIPFLKLYYDRGISLIKTLINYKGNKKWQKDKSLIYNEVGNGGLSLRKREKFIEVLEKLPEVAKIYLDKKNTGQFYAEDTFFSIEPKRNGIIFSKPNYKEACGFSIENKQQQAMEINKGMLPFGCHRWNKEKNFWKPYFLKYGYSI